MNLFLWVSLTLALAQAANAATNNFYAVVIEGRPDPNINTSLTAYQTMVSNLNKSVDIIVLPEYGLTGNLTWETLKNLAKTINNSSLTNDKDIKSINQWANDTKALVVANLLEKDGDDFYSTTIVLDGGKTIVAKYRKINTEDYESNLKSGDAIVSFKTTKFGEIALLAGSDILHENPAQEIIKSTEATVIVYTAALKSTAPLKAAVSVLQGYAQANGITLLAANLNDPKNGLTGSVISVGAALKSFFIGLKQGTQVLNGQVELNQKRTNSCDPDTTSQLAGTNFPLAAESDLKVEFKLDGLETEIIDNETFHMNKCSGSFCCDFDITAGWLKGEVYRIGVKGGNEKACVLLYCGSSQDEDKCDIDLSRGSNTTFLQVIIQTSNDDKVFRPYGVSSNLNPLKSPFCQNKHHVTFINLGPTDVKVLGITTASGATTLHLTLGVNLVALIAVLKYFV